jgi:hypothetical protein
MRGRWPCTLSQNGHTLFVVLVSLLFAQLNAISYRCENNQVLIVQSFGNDTIRMHCQQLHLCGHDKMVCFFSIVGKFTWFFIQWKKYH